MREFFCCSYSRYKKAPEYRGFSWFTCVEGYGNALSHIPTCRVSCGCMHRQEPHKHLFVAVQSSISTLPFKKLTQIESVFFRPTSKTQLAHCQYTTLKQPHKLLVPQLNFFGLCGTLLCSSMLQRDCGEPQAIIY